MTTPTIATPEQIISELRKLDNCIAKARRMRARRYAVLRSMLSSTMRDSKIGLKRLSSARGFNKHRLTNVIYNENSSLSADEWQVLFNFLDRENRRREAHRLHLESIPAD